MADPTAKTSAEPFASRKIRDEKRWKQRSGKYSREIDNSMTYICSYCDSFDIRSTIIAERFADHETSLNIAKSVISGVFSNTTCILLF